MNAPDRVTGQALGVAFPTSVAPLRAQGAEFLTIAFRASGALEPDNAVTAITAFEEFVGGGMGRKVKLSVTYAKPAAHLHTELFAKFTRDFGDPLRELFAPIMEPETRFALLSMRPNFPVAVPKCYFADYDPTTRAGILITERIAFGTPPIEAFQDKCLDYEITAPLPRYRALITAIAKLAAAHKAGQFGAEIDRQFPFHAGEPREHDLIAYSPQQLTEKIATLTAFARRFPRMFPAELTSADNLARFESEAQEYLKHERTIKRHLNSRAEYIALCHWNANIDNAWFWRTADGGLSTGLLDWGSVSQMNVAQSIFGVLCAVETDFWDAHSEELVQLFADEYLRYGGPMLDRTELKLHLRLFVALLGMAWMLDAPAIIGAQLPQLQATDDRYSTALKNDFLARAQLHLLTVLLHVWRREQFGAVLRQFLARYGR